MLILFHPCMPYNIYLIFIVNSDQNGGVREVERRGGNQHPEAGPERVQHATDDDARGYSGEPPLLFYVKDHIYYMLDFFFIQECNYLDTGKFLQYISIFSSEGPL